MDLVMGIVICAAVLFLLFSCIGAFLIYRKLTKKEGETMIKPTKRQVEEVEQMEEEEIEEPDTEDIETVDEGENEEPEIKPKKESAFCMVVVEGGKAYRGEFLGEEPQLVTLANNQLVKVDSYWVMLKTEKVPLLRINRQHIILMAFESLPTQKQPQKPIQKKTREVQEAEETIESINI
jgi:hypothetical protein